MASAEALRVSEVQRGVFVKPINTTLQELGERYLEHAKLHKRSWKRDQQMLAKLEAYFGEVKLRDITPIRVEDFQRNRVKEVSPATSNREMALMKHMFNLAERWGQHQGANPVKFVKFLPEDNERFETLSEEQEEKLLNASPPYLRELISFAINTGLRTSDIFNLQWKEVDIEQQRLKKIVKKSDKHLSLPLSETALGIVLARQSSKGRSSFIYSPMTCGKFKHVRGALESSEKRAGRAGITSHQFRHTFATRLTLNGTDIVTVKDLLGHADLHTTMRYAHSNDDAKRRGVNKLTKGANDNSKPNAASQ